MDNKEIFELLSHLRVKAENIINAGKITGILSNIEQTRTNGLQEIEKLKLSIAKDIAYDLVWLMKYKFSGFEPNYKKYFSESSKITDWVLESLDFYVTGLKFKQNIFVSIPRSEFKEFNISKNKFVSEINEFWTQKNDPSKKFASLSEYFDESKKINFIFNLHGL